MLLAGAPALFAAATPAVAAKDLKKLQEDLVLILRVKEAALQESRLIKTGKYKELQRLDVKRAIKFMLNNYALQDRMIASITYIDYDRQQEAKTCQLGTHFP